GELGRQLDPTLPWGIAKGAARFGYRIKVVIEHDDLTGATRGVVVARGNAGVHLRVTVRLGDLVIRSLLEGRLLGDLGHLAIAVNHPAIGRLGGGVTGADLVAQLLVPHHLAAVFRDWERQTVATGRIDRQTILQ